MKNKQLWKALGAGTLALSMLVSPVFGASAQAAALEPASGSALDLDPTRDETIPAVGTESDADYQPEKPAYADTEIPVWAYTEDTTVYSADIEWGAMTFQYEVSSWDPKTHMRKPGTGWKVYDSVNDEALKATEDVINEIKVTNHSNAPVYATLAYASETGYEDTTGGFSFTAGTEDGDTNKLTGADPTNNIPAYLTLATADNSGDPDTAGTATVGKAYFMPSGIKETDGTVNEITKWTTIGKITVSLKTTQPTAPATEESSGS